MTAPAERGPWVFEFVAPDRLMNMNERLHWTTQRRRARNWRNAARRAMPWYIPEGSYLPPSIVQIELPVLGNLRRDPSNWYPTVKHIVDGLVDAHLWPDDTPQWVTTVEPVLVPYKRTDLHRPVRVLIIPRGDQ
jgi:hypothetical protein